MWRARRGIGGLGRHIISCAGETIAIISFAMTKTGKSIVVCCGKKRLTHPFILHAYCLMTNHVHLQLETQNIAPGQILKMINMKYAIFFNKKYRFVGQLLQGRFRAEIIDSDEYFLAINRYIHLNPVKADMVKDPYDYTWSSYREYFEELPNPLEL